MYTVINNNRLYAILRAPFENSNDSGILSFEIGESGSLSEPSEIISTKGRVACHLCVDGENVYAVNYVSGSVCLLPDTLKIHNGSSIHETRQESAHTHFISLSPDNEYLLVTDLGMDKIFVYDKKLKLIGSVDAIPGVGPRHLEFSQDGDYVYCANELSSSVSVYGYENGTLTRLGDYPALPDDFRGESTAAAIRRAGSYLYMSNRGHNSITCFEIKGDKLERKSITDCGGKSPRDFIIFDNLLICTNETDGTVCVFEVKNNTELLLKQTVSIKNALCATVS